MYIYNIILQVAPGIKDHRPTQGERVTPLDKWYRGMTYGANSSQNYHFYGLTVDKTLPMEPVYRSAKQSYRADGISAITKLQATHFDDFHSFKLEWQPGAEGYLIWYMDNEKLFELKQDALDPHGTKIPTEPSYVILNTAVASSWGFPLPCPPGCPCSCYDCNDPDCSCSFFPGFCNSLPAHFMVDSVRVYQARNDSSQYLSCDPPSHPTRLFIKAHPDR
jgi:beta-glucan synthesis-associated protein KRE6